MKRFFKAVLFLLVVVIGYFGYTTYPKLDIVTGFSAKSVASHYFIGHQSQQKTEKEDNNISSLSLAKNKIDTISKTVTASVLGIKSRKAQFKEGVGAILLPPNIESLPKTFNTPNRFYEKIEKPFPYGELEQKDTIFSTINYDKLNKAISEAFTPKNKTRGVLVIYKDKIISEKYADGFTKNSLFLGWSMTKSVTNAVLGVLEKEGKISLDQRTLFPAWNDDARKNITLRNLLNMNSGLAWDEDYTQISDVTKMLFLASDMSQVQKEKPLIAKPNNAWNYSSGTTNMLSGFIRNQFPTQQEYLDYWYKALIDKIGMHSMIIETDFTGNYVGSSYGWATARDWAKFGLLYLHNGNWDGQQVLNPSWVAFSKTPTKGSKGVYGGHFWLNAGKKFKDVPQDMFSCNGYQGQYVFIIPSKNLVVVRTGLLENPDFDANHFLSQIIQSIQ